MHVSKFIHNLLSDVIHLRRLNSLIVAVIALIDCKNLTLSAIAKSINLNIQVRSCIQKVNRLLGNLHLLREYDQIAIAVCRMLISKKLYPHIIVDWTKYPNSKDVVLRASLITEGRALTLYESIHSSKKMGNNKVQRKFLEKLKQIIPSHCKPIIVTDAGFHNDWFSDVEKLGWDYIGRIRGKKKYRNESGSKFFWCKNLFKFATNTPKCLGKLILTRKNSKLCNFVIYVGKLKGRKALTKGGKKRRDKDSKNYARSYREPYLLVTSLEGRTVAKKVVTIYKRRMTIEEAFRDLKSPKYGFGLESGRTLKRVRRNNLLLIAMLASLVLYLTGLAAEANNLQFQFQSNSIKNRRVISLFNLGWMIIKKAIKITLTQLYEAISSLIKEEIYV